MAVEACVVQLLVTGFVHADPHEGNLRTVWESFIKCSGTEQGGAADLPRFCLIVTSWHAQSSGKSW